MPDTSDIVARLSTAPRLPISAGGDAIPAMRMRDEASHTISVEATATRNTVPCKVDTQIVSLYATVDCFVKFGATDAVAATSADHFYPAGIYMLFAKDKSDLYISTIRTSSNGVLYVSEFY